MDLLAILMPYLAIGKLILWEDKGDLTDNLAARLGMVSTALTLLRIWPETVR
jgi:hypothetical protein